MTKKLSYVIKSGKTTPTRKDRQKLARKRLLDDETENTQSKTSRGKSQSSKKAIKKSSAEKEAALEKLDLAKSKRKALTELEVNEFRDEASFPTLTPNSSVNKSRCTESVDTIENVDEEAEEQVYENNSESLRNLSDSDDEEYPPTQSKRKKKARIVEDDLGDDDDGVLAKALAHLDKDDSLSSCNSFDREKLLADLSNDARHSTDRNTVRLGATVDDKATDNTHSLLLKPQSDLIDQASQDSMSAPIEGKEEIFVRDNFHARDKIATKVFPETSDFGHGNSDDIPVQSAGALSNYRESPTTKTVTSSTIQNKKTAADADELTLNSQCTSIDQRSRESGTFQTKEKEKVSSTGDLEGEISDGDENVVVTVEHGNESSGLSDNDGRESNLSSDGKRHTEGKNSGQSTKRTSVVSLSGSPSTPAATTTSQTEHLEVQVRINVNGVAEDATKNKQELIEELQKTRAELEKTREELSVAREKLELRESQLEKLGNQFEDFERSLHNAVKKGCRPLRACMESGGDAQEYEMASPNSTFNATNNDPITPEIAVGGDSEKKPVGTTTSKKQQKRKWSHIVASTKTQKNRRC